MADHIQHCRERRTDPWYGEYFTCLRFYLHEAGCLRPGDHKGLDLRIKMRREWGRRHRSNAGSWATAWEPIIITDQQAARLHHMLEFLDQRRDLHRRTISNDWIYVYTNQHSMIQDICDIDYVKRSDHAMKITQCELQGEPGSICLQQSQHRYRTYLRERQLEYHTALSLKRYLHAQTDIRMSPSLRNWGDYWTANQGHYFTYNQLFFDHSDPGTAQMLCLIVPDIVRKTQPIITLADK